MVCQGSAALGAGLCVLHFRLCPAPSQQCLFPVMRPTVEENRKFSLRKDEMEKGWTNSSGGYWSSKRT